MSKPFPQNHCAHVARYYFLRYWSFDCVPGLLQQAIDNSERWKVALGAARDPRGTN